MRWKNLRLRTKFGIGFGGVLFLLCLVVALSYTGVGGIVANAIQVIEGNKLDGFLAQKEVDHLNWAKKLTGLIIDDDVKTLNAETDHHKCNVGKWLYGQGRRDSEKRMPSLAPLLKKFESVHERLHTSAIEIGRSYRSVDHRLGWFLREKKSDHLRWMNRIMEALMDVDTSRVDVQTNHQQCTLGKWLYSSQTAEMKAADSKFATLAKAFEGPHRHMHTSVIEINRLLGEGKHAEAVAFFNTHTRGKAHETIAALDRIRDWHDGLIEMQEDVEAVYAYETKPALAEVQELLQKIRQEAKRQILSAGAMLDAARDTRRNVSVLGVAAIVIGLLLAFFIARTMTGIITKAVQFAERISTGDFTRTLDIDQKDELGTLAKALSQIVSNLGRMIKDVTSGVETLSASSSQLSAVSNQMSTSAGQTASQAETVAAGAEEMSTNTTSVAAAMEQAATNVGMVSSAADQMTATIGEIAQNTEKARTITATAVTRSHDASDQVGELGEAAKAIGQVVETITEISEQVNLLALNATIEAARAGEAGKGFAVVANEIKELARQTAEATGEIKNRIEGIQSSTEGTVKGIGGISNVVTEINEIVSTIATAVEEQSVTTREIADNVTQAAAGIGEVNQNVAQSSSAAGEIAQEIAKVSQGSAQMNSGTRQVRDSAKELNKLADDLNGMVARFKM